MTGDAFADRVAVAIESIPSLSQKTAVFVARAGNMVVVNVGDTSVTVPFVGLSLPPAGHPVVLQAQDRQLVCAGAARPLPGVGEITSTGSPRATVTAWGVTYSLPFDAGYTPVLGDSVYITWSADGGVIQGSLTAKSNVVPPPANAGGGGVQRYTPPPFTAVDAGSFGYGGWTKQDVWASDSFTGAWFMGQKIKDTIPDGAQVIAAAMNLSPRQTGGAAPRLQLHTSSTRPGGGVTFVGAVYEPPARSGWVPIPLSFIDYLKANDGGIGVNHGGYNIFKGMQADNLSGAISVVYDA